MVTWKPARSYCAKTKNEYNVKTFWKAAIPAPGKVNNMSFHVIGQEKTSLLLFSNIQSNPVLKWQENEDTKDGENERDSQAVTKAAMRN